ncbi:hypothetical protein UB45_20245 [Terrabacter sp. 28]|jgi:hypothetical protein|nr:hypothetical protein UB45_20245 [Terrabacter sp. 28]
MTTRILSLGSLRSFASAARRGHLAGSSWLVVDRDLDRVAGDLLAVAHADPERLFAPAVAAPVAPVDLSARRARSAAGTSVPRDHAPHAQAS